MVDVPAKEVSMPVGVLVQRKPGVTRWTKWVWQVSGVLPGAGAADWRLVRQDGDVSEFHAATLPLVLHRAETEAYRTALTTEPPSLWVVLREDEALEDDEYLAVHLVTASPFDAQDYLDSGEEIVEAVEMPPAVVAWVRDFVAYHHVDEPFKKRKRRNWSDAQHEDGVGDPRIRQDVDVYRAPNALKTPPRGGAS